jgi:ubiquitin C-terminal hydrolase
MNPAYPQIVSQATDRDFNGIVQTRNTLYVERMRLDKFFTLFLDKFERNMDPDNTNTPIWNLYKTKLKEYDDVQRSIKAADYYLTKQNV